MKRNKNSLNDGVTSENIEDKLKNSLKVGDDDEWKRAVLKKNNFLGKNK